MTEKLSEKLNGRIPAYLLTELRQLEQERDTLKEQLNKPKNKCATCGKRENICADHALWVEECDGYVEVETHLRKIIDLIGKNEIRLVRENLGLKARLAKAQEHIKVAENFIRDEDWSDYLASVEEKALGDDE